MNTIKAKDVNSKKTKVFVSFVLDESGSMSTGRDVIVRGMNEQIQSIKKRFAGSAIEPIVSFVKFSDNVISLYEGRPVEDLKEFEIVGYNPGGSTALYDAVGYTIDMVQRFDGINDEGNSSLLVVITDGEENASRKFTSAQIAEKVQSLNKSGKWTVTYLGPNSVDLTKVKQDTNIVYGNMYSADLTSSIGYTKAFNTMSSGMNTYFSGATCNAAQGLSYVSDSFYVDSATDVKDKATV